MISGGGPLKSVGKALGFGGGGTPKGVTNPDVLKYANDLYSRLTSIMGPQSGAITGKQGVDQATQGYDFGPTDQALKGFETNSTYTTTPYNFEGLPETYGTKAYEQIAPDIRREAAGQLQSTREAIGTRRPGLLLKAAQQNSRNIGEMLAKVRSGIGLQEANQNVELKKAQQEGNVAQNQWAQGQTADEKYRNKMAMGGLGLNKIGTQQQAVEAAREYQFKPMDYLSNLYQTATGGNNTSAATGANYAASRYNTTMNFLKPNPKIV